MATPDEDSTNPYAPTTISESIADDEQIATNAKLVKDFRSQSLALGVLWILIASLCIGLSLVFLNARSLMSGDAQTRFANATLLGGVGIAWLVSGTLALTKNIWGVYFGLVLSYLWLIGVVLQVNICAFVIVIIVLIQAHRVIGFANKMKKLGIPLTQRV